MRHLFVFVLLMALVGSGAEAESPAAADHGTPDGRQGGETMSDAFVIPDLPFTDTGNTSDNVHDYDAAACFGSPGFTAPDVVYSYTPAADEVLGIDLCGSSYNTRLYIMDGNMDIIACDDNFYFDHASSDCGPLTSRIEAVSVTGGTEYFIVVDGFLEYAGDYVLAVDRVDPSLLCHIAYPLYPPIWYDIEPPLGPGYVDLYNSGCDDESGTYPYIVANSFGTGGSLDFVGASGWTDPGVYDTDWIFCLVGPTGVCEWTMDAEQETYGFFLDFDYPNCDDVVVLDQMIVGPCEPGSMTLIESEPGGSVWIKICPTGINPPAGFFGYQYDYVAHFEGLLSGLSTESITLDKVKSLYR